MAEIIEGTPSEPTDEDVVVDLFATDEAGMPVNPEVEEAPAATNEEPKKDEGTDPDLDESIPAKFRGKSAAEIAASYQDLEREFGRRNNELGELRKITDDILKAQLTPAQQAAADSDDDLSADDLLSNPKEVIAKAVAATLAADPRLKAIEEKEATDIATKKFEAFKAAHPDAKDVMANPAFAEWLNKVPGRADRFMQADANLDWDTANEVISTYKEVHQVSTAEGEANRQDALRDVRSAPAGAKAGGSKRKIFRKADLERLRDTDPMRYEQLQPVILQAYLEKRVI